MDLERIVKLQTGYDEVAEEYVRRIYGELEHKPIDRRLLDDFVARLRGAGPVCDLGCGPGHVARYLRDRGVDVFGLDLSEGMLRQARRLNPDIVFRQSDMTALTDPDGVWAGVVAFYSLIHVPRADVVRALEGLRRVLRPGGLLFMAFHVGDEVYHVEDLWGHAVSLDFTLFQAEEMKGYLRMACFEVDETTERDPYPDVEYPSQRCYILARKP